MSSDEFGEFGAVARENTVSDTDFDGTGVTQSEDSVGDALANPVIERGETGHLEDDVGG